MTITTYHRTRYTFDQPVFLEPHVFRLTPRPAPGVRVLEHRLIIDPHPTVRADNLDPHGNSVTETFFEETTTSLVVESHAVVDSLAADPFRFLLAEPERTLPYAYPLSLGSQLTSYRTPPDAAHPAVRDLALRAAKAADRRQDRFPLVLARLIGDRFTLEDRAEGGPVPPAETAASNRGAARDLAWLYVACCRAMGLAARFVNGYATVTTQTGSRLHAWGEVYLPGGGWRGFDPTFGVAAADRHVPLAAGIEPVHAAPVSGSYRGDARATLATDLQVSSEP